VLQVSEAAMLENLEYLESNKPAFPIQLVQLDDGYPVCVPSAKPQPLPLALGLG
jgi:hypothetical protein